MNSNVLQKPNVDCHLINVASKGDMRHMADFPYGMALITSYLRDQGFNTLMTQYPTWEKEKNLPIILDNRAYLYGFQVNFENYPEIRELVKIIKKNLFFKLLLLKAFILNSPLGASINFVS